MSVLTLPVLGFVLTAKLPFTRFPVRSSKFILTYRLEPYKGSIKHRYDLYRTQLDQIENHEGGLDEFSKGYEKRGFIVDEKNGVRYTEWAPGVKEARLIGDFSEFLTTSGRVWLRDGLVEN